MESMDSTQIVTESTEKFTEGVMDPTQIVAGSTEHVTEGVDAGKRKRKTTAEVIVDSQNMEPMDPTQIVSGSTGNVEGFVDPARIAIVSIENVTKGVTETTQIVIGTIENVTEGFDTGKKEKKQKIKDGATLDLQTSKEHRVEETSCNLTTNGPQPNKSAGENEKFGDGVKEMNKEIIVDLVKYSAEDCSVLSTCNVEVVMNLSSDAQEAECSSQGSVQYPVAATMTANRRKLLVLDVNGLLAHIMMPAPKDRRGDMHILGRAIFKRPFCDEFLKFCFQNFYVAVWSSRSKKIIDRVVDYLLGDLKHALLFCWDMEHSTQTGFRTLENNHKPLVFKELRKIWENADPRLPWKKGDYDESNTLLVDDSPYKALLNPLNTAIFPKSYHYEDKDDNSIGPGGDLRVYLEGLLASDNVQKYVEQNPFGQGAINETNTSWEFYSGVLQTLFNRPENNALPLSLPTLPLHE